MMARRSRKRSISGLVFSLSFILSVQGWVLPTKQRQLSLTRVDRGDILPLCSTRGPPRRRQHSPSEGQRRGRPPQKYDSRRNRNQRPKYDDSDDFCYDDSPLPVSTYVATCIPGLAPILQQELTDLECCRRARTVGSAAVEFEATAAQALRALIGARVPHKIMELLCESPPSLSTREDVLDFVRDGVSLRDLLGDGHGGLLTLAVSVILKQPAHIPPDINHSHFTALTVKNALCDAVRAARGDRPSVDVDNPDVPLVAVVTGHAGARAATLALYRQIHTGSLHKRGYKADAAVHKAALKESLAAALLLQTDWRQRCRQARTARGRVATLLDPMAGSGTLLVEGAMLALDVAPHLMRLRCSNDDNEVDAYRRPPILRWKHTQNDGEAWDVEEEWRHLLTQANQKAQSSLHWMRENPSKIRLMGNEIHLGAVELLEDALHKAGMRNFVDVDVADCADWDPFADDDDHHHHHTSYDSKEGDIPPPLVVCNPPWGERLTEDVSESWDSLRVFLRDTCPLRTTAFVLSGNADLTRNLKLKKSGSLSFRVGSLGLRWIKYEIRPPPRKESFASESATATQRWEMEPSPQAPQKSIQSPPRKRPSFAGGPANNDWLLD